MIKAGLAVMTLSLFAGADSVTWLRDFTAAAKRAKISGKVRIVAFAVDKSGKAC